MSQSNDYYDEYERDYVEPPMKWSDILMFPVVLLFMFFFAILPPLVLILYFLNDVYSTLKRTINSGKLSYPSLAYVGALLAMILVVANSGRSENARVHLSSSLVLAIGFIFIFTILPFLALCLHLLIELRSFVTAKFGGMKIYALYLGYLGIFLAIIFIFLNFSPRLPPIHSLPPETPVPTRQSTATSQSPQPTSAAMPNRSIDILVDDFSPQPYQGQSTYFFNRLEGDRGAINDSTMDWGNGHVTTTISAGNSWGGVWMSLNHPIREGLPINFSAILPSQIVPAYQSQITGMTIRIVGGTPNRTFRVELKDANELRWKQEIILDGGQQIVNFDLPALGNSSQLVWVLDHASAGDHVVLDRVSFTATTQITDTATGAFVWSYGMLLNNWNPATGLVRDKAKDASGEFDAIQATGTLAAATALAQQLGVVSRADAIQIVNKISNTLLIGMPRFHGLWPHWVTTSPAGDITIVQNTEWSSVDTVIAAIGLFDAQTGLGIDTSGTEQMLQGIDWNDLVTDKGISHGYSYAGDLMPFAWDAFGGESWLVAVMYASVTGQVAPITYPSPPTANGSGFIDELAWLFVPPPSGPDYWGTDWTSYRLKAADNQTSYYPTHDRTSCFAQLGLFGLSAAEVPSPSLVPQGSLYQAFGVGGQFAAGNDGSALLGAPVVAPHYSAMIASLHPQEAIRMWDWLIDNGHFSPLNNVESFMFPAGASCDSVGIEWNQLKGSWNLSLQTLGWGRYLAERNGQVPILWQATTANPLLQKGYLLLASRRPTPTLRPTSAAIPTPIAVYIPRPSETPVTTIWDNTQVSCDGKPYNMWNSPGTYIYKHINDSGSKVFITVEQESGKNSLSYGENRPPQGGISAAVVGVEHKTIGLGTFQATRVDTNQEYSILTGRLDIIKGVYKTSEWYVCGYGLIQLITSDTGTKMGVSYGVQSTLELLSFTPLSTNESHVRYILADIQLGNAVDYYRANTMDEETAEALRRWDAGLRVINIERFERRVVNGQWQIVYAGTENHINGTEVNLTSDLKQ